MRAVWRCWSGSPSCVCGWGEPKPESWYGKVAAGFSRLAGAAEQPLERGPGKGIVVLHLHALAGGDVDHGGHQRLGQVGKAGRCTLHGRRLADLQVLVLRDLRPGDPAFTGADYVFHFAGIGDIVPTTQVARLLVELTQSRRHSHLLAMHLRHGDRLGRAGTYRHRRQRDRAEMLDRVIYAATIADRLGWKRS